MRGFLAQLYKDWLEFRRDLLSLALAFLLPLASLFLFSFGIRLETKHIPTEIVDRDNTIASRSFARRIFASETFVPAESDDIKVVRTRIDIPYGFEGSINLNKPASVLFTIDGTALTEAHTASTIAQAFGPVFSAAVKPPDPRLQYILPRITVWFNPGLQESLFIVSGAFGVILWMFPSLLAAVSMSRDLEHGSIVQPFCANLKPLSFLLGKLGVYLIIGVVQSALITVVGCLLFDLKLVDSPLLFALCTVLYLVVAILFGLWLGLLTRSQTAAVQATSSGGFFPSLLLSGFVYPLSNIPFPLSLLSYLVPARYYIDVTRDTFMRGTGWQVVTRDVVPLCGFACLLLFLCWWQLRDMRLKD